MIYLILGVVGFIVGLYLDVVIKKLFGKKEK